MFSTPNMGLTAWDQLGDPYDHTQLANNMSAIDGHDHTSAKGVQVPTGGIVNAAITSAKLGPAAVLTSNLGDAAVTTVKISDGAVTIPKLDPSIQFVPLGTTSAWFRPNSGVPVPTGWVIPTGQTLSEVAGDHNWVGAGNVTLPDLRNKFILGADTSGTGSGPSTPPAELAVGGSHTLALSHTHTVNDHQHPIPSHTHDFSHTHTANHAHGLGAHSHTITGDGAHTHLFVDNSGNSTHRINSRVTTIRPASRADSSNVTTDPFEETQGGYGMDFLYLPGSSGDPLNAGITSHAPVDMETVSNHSHGGSTGAAVGSTDSATVTTSGPSTSTTGTQSNADPTDLGGTLATTQAGLTGSTDSRPGFVGMLIIMKVKH